MKSECRKNNFVSESRKIRKPLMEKKRRARINDSLETLKRILLESKTTFQESVSRRGGQKTAKLEKADILEMTVCYLQHLHEKLGQTAKQAPARSKEQVLVQPADSSCDSSLKVGVTLIPTRLENGSLAFVVPSAAADAAAKREEFEEKGPEAVWRPW